MQYNFKKIKSRERVRSVLLYLVGVFVVVALLNSTLQFIDQQCLKSYYLAKVLNFRVFYL